MFGTVKCCSGEGMNSRPKGTKNVSMVITCMLKVSPKADLPCYKSQWRKIYTTHDWLLHIVRTFNFKSIHSTNISHFLCYPAMSCWITPQICFPKWTKYFLSSEPGFTFDNPDYSSWQPQACVRREHGCGKPWNKLDKCYFWRNVKMGCRNLIEATMLEIGWNHTLTEHGRFCIHLLLTLALLQFFAYCLQ